jgi:RNA polymerase sigma-70 factor (ECF subfamily)
MEHKQWKELCEQYYRPLYLYALSLTKSRQDAEDLLQETFTKACLSYQAGGSLKAWLITVLRNEFFNLQRRRKKELLDDGETVLNHVPACDDPLDTIILQEERRMLFRAIQQLPPGMKTVLMESVYFQMKDDEIAALHGRTAENIRQIRSRAKKKLLELLKEA